MTKKKTQQMPRQRSLLRVALVCSLVGGPAQAEEPPVEARPVEAQTAEAQTVEARPAEAPQTAPPTTPQTTIIDVQPDGSLGGPIKAPRRPMTPRQRRAVLGTLLGAGGAVLLGAALGGAALWRAGQLQAAQQAGDPVEALATSTRALAFSADLCFGSGALLGLTALVLRFGGGGQSDGHAQTPASPTDIPGEAELGPL